MQNDAVQIFLDEVKCELQRFQPKAGDVFVLTIPDEISQELADRMTRYWNDHLPYKVLVVSGGMTMHMNAESR